MALPININDLLNKNKVESNRIEFKKSWNPVSVYHSICAFANDFDNIGGGYILIGVEEENGIAKRPVCGLPTEQLDAIQREIIGYNNFINPYYAPRLSAVYSCRLLCVHGWKKHHQQNEAIVRIIRWKIKCVQTGLIGRVDIIRCKTNCY